MACVLFLLRDECDHEMCWVKLTDEWVVCFCSPIRLSVPTLSRYAERTLCDMMFINLMARLYADS